MRNRRSAEAFERTSINQLPGISVNEPVNSGEKLCLQLRLTKEPADSLALVICLTAVGWEVLVASP